MSEHIPRLIVIAEEPSQRLAFGEAVKACGFEIVDCVPSERINEKFLQLNSPDLWLIDARNDVDIIEQLQNSDKYLLGFTPAPPITDLKSFGKWQRRLRRKLYQVLGKPPSAPAHTLADEQTQSFCDSVTQTSLSVITRDILGSRASRTANHAASQSAVSQGATNHVARNLVDDAEPHARIQSETLRSQEVQPTHKLGTHNKLHGTYFKTLLVLGASFGGPDAIKLFLDHLPCDLPLRAILAQHIDPQAAKVLPSILTRNNMWRCQLIDDEQTLSPGVLYLVPPDKKIAFHGAQVALTDEPWNNHYKPCISDVMLSANRALGHRVLNIIFSGMGDDGSSAIKQVTESGSKVWAQSLDSAICDSQPSAAIDTGLIELTGAPDVLAKQVASYVVSHSAKPKSTL